MYSKYWDASKKAMLVEYQRYFILKGSVSLIVTDNVMSILKNIYIKMPESF